MRFWLSWYEESEDYRPLTFPPNEAILGWWCSGYCSDDSSTIVALVEAGSEEAAWKAVRLDWPEAVRERFCEAREDSYLPGDRFPLSDWMKERIDDN